MIERPFRCPAIFVVAPVALLASLYLLFKQIISKHGDMLMTGEIFICWLIIIFILYVIKVSWFKEKKALENND